MIPKNEDEENEAKMILAVIVSQRRRAECGSVVNAATELLEIESVPQMRHECEYGMVSNLKVMYPVIESRAYQINWGIGHLPTGNSFLSFVAPVF